MRPKRMLRRAPASGNAGISQTALDTGPIYRGARGVSRKPPTAARLLCVAGKQELRLVEGLGSHLAEAALLVEAPQGLVQRRLVGIAGQRVQHHPASIVEQAVAGEHACPHHRDRVPRRAAAEALGERGQIVGDRAGPLGIEDLEPRLLVCLLTAGHLDDVARARRQRRRVRRIVEPPAGDAAALEDRHGPTMRTVYRAKRLPAHSSAIGPGSRLVLRGAMTTGGLAALRVLRTAVGAS